ncbi:ATP-binding protein [Enterococcus faecalis]
MRLKQPFHKVYQNVLITKENEVWAYFTCPSEYVIGQNKEVQEKHKRKWSQFLQSLRRFEDFELFLNPHSYNLNERLSAFSKSFDEQAQDMGNALIDRTLSELESQLRVITTEKFYIGVKLSSLSSATSLKGKIMELVDYYAGKLLAITHYHMTVDEDFLARYRIIEAEVFQLVGAINSRRLTEKEVLQVCRYPYVRGMDTSFDSDFIEKEEYSLTDTILDPTEEQGLLKLRSLGGTSYIALLPIHKFAPNLAFNHVAELVQSLPFPVEFRLKAHFEPLKGGKGLKGKSSRASKRLKNSAKETLSMGDAEMKSSRFNRYALTDLNNKIDLRVPVIKWLGLFGVFGQTPEECRSRIRTVLSLCQSRNVNVVKGLADQVFLFHQFLSGNKLGPEKNWIHYTTVEGISELMIGVENRIGDNVGIPIGMVSELKNTRNLTPKEIAKTSRKPIFFNPSIGNQSDIADKKANSPHIAITGPTGNGKSYLAKFVFFLSVLMKGKGLYVDPKSEFFDWIMEVINDPVYQKKYPETCTFVQKHFHQVRLDPDKESNKGVLDPICFIPNRVAAKDMAQDLFEELYDFTSAREKKSRLAMLEGIEVVLKKRDHGERVGLLHVVDFMLENTNEEVRDTANLIKKSVQGSILELAFSYGENEGLNLHNKVTVLEVLGLEMPRAETLSSDYSATQRKSIMLMMCIGKFCELFGLRDREESTVVLFDESWIFNTSKNGRAIIKSMRRVGRSFNNTLIIVTQSVKDTAEEDDTGNFGRIFAYDDKDEREEILRHLGLEVSEENIEWLKNLPKYHCLYLDLRGRVGKMLVYCPYEELHQMLQTVKKNSSADVETAFSA